MKNNDLPAMGCVAMYSLSDAPISIFSERCDCGAINNDECLCDELEAAERSLYGDDDDDICYFCNRHLVFEHCNCNDYELSEDDVYMNNALKNGEFDDFFSTPIISSNANDDGLPY